jgi:hypothetical protein
MERRLTAVGHCQHCSVTCQLTSALGPPRAVLPDQPCPRYKRQQLVLVRQTDGKTHWLGLKELAGNAFCLLLAHNPALLQASACVRRLDVGGAVPKQQLVQVGGRGWVGGCTAAPMDVLLCVCTHNAGMPLPHACKPLLTSFTTCLAPCPARPSGGECGAGAAAGGAVHGAAASAGPDQCSHTQGEGPQGVAAAMDGHLASSSFGVCTTTTTLYVVYISHVEHY